MPTTEDTPAQQIDTPAAEQRPSTPPLKKQCPRCTFLNHPELTACEMCQGELPDTLVSKPPSPAMQKSAPKSTPSHSHSASLPPPATAPPLNKQKGKEHLRPAAPNRNSLSSTLFSIFPFSQQQQTEHHPHLPDTQPKEPTSPQGSVTEQVQAAIKKKSQPEAEQTPQRQISVRQPSPTPRLYPDSPPAREPEPQFESRPHTPELSRPPEMAMLPMTPSPATPDRPREFPIGMPKNLMDDFIPVSPALPRDDEEDDAGWGQMSKDEARADDSEDEDDDAKRELIDLDAVALDERDVWGDKSDDDE